MVSIHTLQDGPQPHAWTVSGGRGLSDRCQSSVDLADIGRGLSVSDSVDILGLLLPEGSRPEEIWTRGPDLTAIFRPADNRRLRVTAMWRLGSPDLAEQQVRTWQLVLSAQTAMLSTSAELTVVSQVPQGMAPLWGCWRDATVVWQGQPTKTASCWQTRLATTDGAVSRLLFAIHPDEAGCIEAEPAPNGGSRISCQLFPSDVEKGVLLRSRVLVGIGPETEDVNRSASWVDLLVRRFAEMKPILTT